MNVQKEVPESLHRVIPRMCATCVYIGADENLIPYCLRHKFTLETRRWPFRNVCDDWKGVEE